MILGKEYSVQELAMLLQAQGQITHNHRLQELAYDTRQITRPKDAVFYALQGKKRDGHAYCSEAYEQGVRCFVVSKEVYLPEDAQILQVENTLQSLQIFAGAHRHNEAAYLIGVTGSNGKTIVKEWLAQLLMSRYTISKSPKSYNSQLGVPLSILQIQPDHDYAVIEVGISETGEMQNLAEITKPNLGILTNVGTAHAAHFSSKHEHIEEKFRLFQDTPSIILSGDDAEIMQYLANNPGFASKEITTFGRKEHNDLQILRYDAEKHMAVMKWHAEEILFPFEHADEASLLNLAAVLAAALHLGFSVEECKELSAQLPSIEMRLQIKDGRDNILIINDAFTADLSSLPIALQVLDNQIQERKTLILTDIEQVNKSEADLYANVSERVNCYPFRVILIGDVISRYAERFLGLVATYPDTESFLKNNPSEKFAHNAVLLKGARRFQLEQIYQAWSSKSHQTVLEINLSHIRQNIDYFRSLLQPKTKMMGMVKAFGYGTGSIELSKLLSEIGFDFLGVAYADEGADLRREGITSPIVVMNPEQNSYDTLITHHLQPEIYSMRVLQNFESALRMKQVEKPWPIHIKLNTGMNRLGFDNDEIPQLISHLKNNDAVEVVSIFSHLAESDNAEQRDFTEKQIENFKAMSQEICSKLDIAPILHILNTAGIVNYRHAQLDMVRLGIGMYGVTNDEAAKKYLQPAVYFKTVISQINEIAAGDSVSYGRRFVAQKPMRVATLPVGYADGLRRSISAQDAYVNVHGRRCPIIGTICMDMLMVDVSDVECKEGDEVILFGDDPDLQQMADWAGTIPYEILTSISHRVRRLYIIN
ncbi:MAG: bifunctional UDP-N-acetylmuramoyl-tripeptide:D-alanyl-D-alanine ligase/alanine racemase [Weeksellaceae bacterium]|nr:bifunctional UDP-N-acetylmuramoyl-tripeptide:D-alanyl-D-alanine ligase/alanine racemase [Weeksellaceae bacterium]